VLRRVAASDAADLLGHPSRDTAGAQVVGALYLLGALLAATSLIFPHPDQGEPAIWAIVLTATLVGAMLLASGTRVTNDLLQVVVALGSGLINLLMLASGVATGVYAAMFCWVVLVSVNFFTLRAAVAQFAWMMGGFAVVLTQVESSGGYSGLTRWIASTMALAVTGGAGAWLVYRRRLAEEETRGFLLLAREMLCAIDGEGRFARVNPAWEPVLGTAPRELRGTRLIDLIHPTDREEMTAALARLRAAPEGEETLDGRCRMAAGGWRPMRWEITASVGETLLYARVRPLRSDGVLEAEPLAEPEPIPADG
jgi:PAS domain S-box-containing protein